MPREEIVRGYGFAKDRYVMFTAEELQVLEKAGTRSVAVAQFVPLAAVDPVYFESVARGSGARRQEELGLRPGVRLQWRERVRAPWEREIHGARWQAGSQPGPLRAGPEARSG